jgi:hypothetical protein
MAQLGGFSVTSQSCPVVWEQPLYFPAFFTFAQRAFCAATILARPAALIFRLPALGDGFAAGLLVGLPSNNSALATWSR